VSKEPTPKTPRRTGIVVVVVVVLVVVVVVDGEQSTRADCLATFRHCHLFPPRLQEVTEEEVAETNEQSDPTNASLC